MPAWGHVATQACKSLCSAPHSSTWTFTPSFTPGMACSTWITEQLLPLSEAQQQEIYSKPIWFSLWNCQVSCQLEGGWQAHMGFQPLSNTALFDSLLWWAAQKSQPLNEDGWAANACLVWTTSTHYMPHTAQKKEMPQRGHSTGYIGLYVLGDMAPWPPHRGKSKQAAWSQDLNTKIQESGSWRAAAPLLPHCSKSCRGWMGSLAQGSTGMSASVLPATLFNPHNSHLN